MNEKQTHILPEEILVESFQPIDIFKPQARTRRLGAGLGRRIYRMAANQAPLSRRIEGRAIPAENSLPPAPGAPEEEARLSGQDEIWGLYLHATAGLLTCRYLAAWLAEAIPGSMEQPSMAAALVFYVILLAFPVIRRALASDQAAEKMKLRKSAPGALWISLLAGLCASLAGCGMTMLWGRALTRMGAEIPQVSRQIPLGQIPLLLISSVLLPAACEELFFRGYMMSAWEERAGKWCVLITAALFMALHADIQGAPAQLSVGCLLGMVCAVSGSVWCAATAHLGYNLGVVVISLAWDSAGWPQEAAVALCGMALAAAVYGMLRRVCGRDHARWELPIRRGCSWQGLVAMYAALTTAILMYLMDAVHLFGGV